MSTTTPALDPKLSDALRAELVQTVQTETTARTVVSLAARSRPRRSGTRLALVAASITGLAIGASLLIPAQNAYAWWSATPRVIDGDPAQSALAECSAGFAGHDDGGLGPTTGEPSWSGGLVEQRGRWQLTLVRGDDGTVGMCMGTLPSDGSQIGGLSVPRPPARASVTVIDNIGVFDHVSRDPRVINGWFGEPEMEGHHYTSGVADDLVGKIVLHTPHGDVTASLTDGLWAAWWPVTYPTVPTPPVPGLPAQRSPSRTAAPSASTPVSWRNCTTWTLSINPEDHPAPTDLRLPAQVREGVRWRTARSALAAAVPDVLRVSGPALSAPVVGRRHRGSTVPAHVLPARRRRNVRATAP